jgi:hypothetical protein
MGSTWRDVLELAVGIELECAALYEVFAKRSTNRRELVYFWMNYAEAERYHAASIRIHQSALAGMPEVGEQKFEVEEKEAASFLAQVRAARERCEREGVTIGEALKLARWVEEHSAELHGRIQFFKVFPEFGDLLQKMAEEDRAHRDLLSSAEKRWANAPA